MLLIFIAGMGGTGKDTVGNEVFKRLLQNNIQIIKIVPNTTRKIRKGEIDGEDYVFLSDKKFDNTEMLEVRTYNKLSGTVKYGTPIPKRDGMYITWGSCDQWVNISKKYRGNSCCIWLDSHAKEKINRMLNRAGDNEDEIIEACRRVYQDNKDFGVIEEKFKPNYIVINHDGHLNDTIENVYSIIHNAIDKYSGGGYND